MSSPFTITHVFLCLNLCRLSPHETAHVCDTPPPTLPPTKPIPLKTTSCCKISPVVVSPEKVERKPRDGARKAGSELDQSHQGPPQTSGADGGLLLHMGPHRACVPKPLKHVLSLSREKHSPFLWEGRTKDVAPALGKWREGCDWLPPAGHRELSVMIRTQHLEDRRPLLAGMLNP